MQWFLGTYTARFNRRHKLFGHLFSGRYKSLIVDGSGSGYLKSVCDYVHLNPVRAKLLRPEQPLKAYRWSMEQLWGVFEAADTACDVDGSKAVALGEWGHWPGQLGRKAPL